MAAGFQARPEPIPAPGAVVRAVDEHDVHRRIVRGR
jgi:hypothetical protein